MRGVNTLAILGTGLMGGSLGMATIERKLASRVVGFDLDPATVHTALERGAITSLAESPEEAVRDAELVFIATPVSAIHSAFVAISGGLAEGAIVSDVGSTKAKVVEEVTASRVKGVHFVGGHPLAGSEKEGIQAASSDLYSGCLWVLTPTEDTDPSAYRFLMHFLGRLDARVISLEPHRHDEAMALSSHLPQLLSSVLMGFAAELSGSPEGLPLLSAGGFQDMTRIAASSPDLWVDIVRENRPALLDVLRQFGTALDGAEERLAAGDWDGLHQMLSAGREARRVLPGKAGVEPSELVEIRIPVPDRTGVLAEVTTTLGEAGVNIEDIDIIHSPEGGRGVVHLVIMGRTIAEQAREAIKQKGFYPEMDDPSRQG